MKKLSNFKKGILSGFGAVLCFSIISTLGIKVYGAGVSPLGVLSFRALAASFLFFLVILFSKRISFKIEKKDITRLLLHSSILAGHLILFWQGLKILNQIAVVHALYFTFPIWIGLFAVLFLKEKLSKTKILSLFLGVVGVMFALQILPALSLASLNLFGVGLMILAATTYAIYLLIGQQLIKKYNLFTILFYNFLFGLVAYCILQNPFTTISQVTATTSVLFYITIMGVISTFLAYAFTYFAVKNFGASNQGIVNLTQPYISIAFAFVLLGQTTTLFQLLGVGFVISAVYLLYKENA